MKPYSCDACGADARPATTCDLCMTRVLGSWEVLTRNEVVEGIVRLVKTSGFTLEVRTEYGTYQFDLWPRQT